MWNLKYGITASTFKLHTQIVNVCMLHVYTPWKPSWMPSWAIHLLIPRLYFTAINLLAPDGTMYYGSLVLKFLFLFFFQKNSPWYFTFFRAVFLNLLFLVFFSGGVTVKIYKRFLISWMHPSQVLYPWKLENCLGQKLGVSFIKLTRLSVFEFQVVCSPWTTKTCTGQPKIML